MLSAIAIALAAPMSFCGSAASSGEVELDVGLIHPVEGSPAPRLEAPGVVELQAPFSTNRNSRVRWNIDFGRSLKLNDGISFDFLCRDNDQVSAFSLYFFYNGGCHTTSFVPGKSGEWRRVTVDKSLVRRMEGSPHGWGDITSVSIAAWRGGTNDTSFLLSNMKVFGAAPEVVVVRGNSAIAKMPKENAVNFHKFAECMTQVIRECGVSAAAVPDCDLDAELLNRAKLVVLPFNPHLPDGAADVLRAFCSDGGKVFACYSLAKGIPEVLGVKVGCSYYLSSKHPENPPFVGMVRTHLSPSGQPEFFPDADADGLVVLEGSGGCDVIGRWAGSDRKATSVPALVRTRNGYHYGGAWSTAGSGGRAMMRSILGEVNPTWRGRFADAEKRSRDAEREKMRWFASQSPKKGEWRAVCCTKSFCDRIDKGNSPFGTWDDAIGFLQRNGFNSILPNYAYANEYSDFGSCLDACRRHGFECHVWKICWEACGGFSKGFKGRTVVTFNGESEPRFMCPSDPFNLASETEMFVELARRGPTGIHLDYIRYMDQDQCFCNGCRDAFEKRIGRMVANWPEDIRESDDLVREWDTFRCSNITALVRAVSNRVRVECPGVQISASVFHTNEETPHKVGQDWGTWCREGLLDFVCPMDYYVGTHFAFKGLVRSHFGYFRDSKAKLRPGIGITCWQSTLDDRENLVEQVKAVRELGLDGFYIFDYSRRMAHALPALRMGLTSD